MCLTDGGKKHRLFHVLCPSVLFQKVCILSAGWVFLAHSGVEEALFECCQDAGMCIRGLLELSSCLSYTPTLCC